MTFYLSQNIKLRQVYKVKSSSWGGAKRFVCADVLHLDTEDVLQHDGDGPRCRRKPLNK